MGRVKGKVAIVTVGGWGLGEAHAFRDAMDDGEKTMPQWN